MSDSSASSFGTGVFPDFGNRVTWRLDNRHERMIRDLPVAESSVVQLSAGDGYFQSRRYLGIDILLLRVFSAPDIAAYLVPAKGWMGLWCPLSWEGDYLRNGQLAEPGNFFLSGYRHGYSVREKRCLHFVLAFRRSQLEMMLTQLLGRPCPSLEQFEGRLRLSPDRGKFFQRRFLETVEVASPGGQEENIRFLTESQEATLSRLAARLFVESGLIERPLRYFGLTDRMIVRAAIDGLDEQRRPPTLSDVCSAARVGSTRLHQAFTAVYGVPPMRFIRHLRLQMARNRLADPEQPPRSVKEVAMELAFDHGGRFAGDYAALFGELPSETLQETRRRADLTRPRG